MTLFAHTQVACYKTEISNKYSPIINLPYMFTIKPLLTPYKEENLFMKCANKYENYYNQ